MRARHRVNAAGTPITLRGRLILSACLLLAAIVMGLGAGVASYHINPDFYRTSRVIGTLLCGEGLSVDDAPSRTGGRRMVCRDAAGVEVGSPNNGVALKMGLPFILLFGAALQMLAWLVPWTRVSR